MITHLKVRNFKALQEADVPLRSLSLFTGLNGMGKSTLMQAILLLRQSYQQQFITNQGLILNGNLVDIGTAQDALNEGASTDDISFEMQLSGSELPYFWQFDAISKTTDVLPLIGFSPDKKIAEILDPLHFSKNAYDEYNSTHLRSLPEEKRTHILSESADRLPFNQNTFQYLNAERAAPQTAYPTSASEVVQRRQLGKHGEYTAHFLAVFGDEVVGFSNLLFPGTANEESDPLDKTNKTSLRNQVSAWLGEISPGLLIDATAHPDFGLARVGYKFPTTLGYTRSFRSTNVGFGLSYILPVLTSILSAKPGSLLLIENPESHIHPRGQSRLGELLALAAQNDVQLLVETHSDHILNGIRVAVKKHKLDPASVGLYFFERAPIEKGGHHSVIREPQIDKDGRIDFWPEGFFDEWDNNLMELL